MRITKQLEKERQRAAKLRIKNKKVQGKTESAQSILSCKLLKINRFIVSRSVPASRITLILIYRAKRAKSSTG
jgi:hypothetical protein